LSITQLLILAGLIFNAGGFVWIARNHFHTVNKRLDNHAGALRDIKDRLITIETMFKAHDRWERDEKYKRR